MQSDVRILATDVDHLRAEWKNLYALVYRNSPKMELMDSVEKELQALVKRFPEGIAISVIIEPGCAAPPAPVRQRSSTILSDLGKTLLGAATVPEGEGVWAASMRSMLVGIQLVVPSGYPHEICRTPDETAIALNKFLGPKAPVADLKGVLDDIRKAFPRLAAPEKKKKSWWQW